MMLHRLSCPQLRPLLASYGLTGLLFFFTAVCWAEAIRLPTPPIVDDRPIMATTVAKEELHVAPSPTPDPTPNPTPSPYKIGDDCPFCVDGFISADSVVKVKCWKCNGDGIINEGDPILETGSTPPSQEILQSASLIELEVIELRKAVADLHALVEKLTARVDALTADSTPVDPAEEVTQPKAKTRYIVVDALEYEYRPEGEKGPGFYNDQLQVSFPYRTDLKPIEEAKRVQICRENGTCSIYPILEK